MALPYFNPLRNQLPDGGIYDPDTNAPIQQTTPLVTKVAKDTADIDAQIAAAKAARDKIKVNQPGLGPKAKASRQENLTTATNTLKALEQKKIDLSRINAAPTDDESNSTTYTAPDGTTFTDQQAYVNYLNRLDRLTSEKTTTASNNALKTAETARSNRNAREFLLGTLKQYFANAEDTSFLSQLEGIIDDYVKQDYDADTISVLLPQSKPYQDRFKGNAARTSAGLSPLSPAEYIQAEEAYADVLKRFNLGDLAKRDTYSTLIGGAVSNAELADRVVNVYDRVRNADPALRAEMNRIQGLSRGVLSDSDFAKALLTGSEGANELKRKISTAEIGAEASLRGLSTTRAQELQQLGVTRQQARAGFEQIAQIQPTLTKLSQIYEETTPDASGLQTELEREQFQGLASERRRKLAQQETTAFMGQSGTAGAQSLARRKTGSY